MRILHPAETLTLAAFFLLANVGNALYAVRGLRPSSVFLFLCYVAIAYAVVAWVIADSRALGVPRPVDHGWLVFSSWPIALPYHLFATRGWRGIFVFAGLVGLFVLTYLVGLAVFFALRP
jgi:hypothetical protein